MREALAAEIDGASGRYKGLQIRETVYWEDYVSGGAKDYETGAPHVVPI